MPHVVIEDADDLGIACQGLQLTTLRNGSGILKVVDVYLNRSSHSGLVDCIVVAEERTALRSELLQRARGVAEAAGEIMGLGSKVSRQENALLSEFARAFNP